MLILQDISDRKAYERKLSASVAEKVSRAREAVPVPCGLILHELISNSLKHAFPGKRAGSLDIRLQAEEGGRARIRISDDGIGMPASFDFGKSEGLGIKTVFALASRIDGAASFDVGRGVACELVFPIPPEPQAAAGDDDRRAASAYAASG